MLIHHVIFRTNLNPSAKDSPEAIPLYLANVFNPKSDLGNG